MLSYSKTAALLVLLTSSVATAGPPIFVKYADCTLAATNETELEHASANRVKLFIGAEIEETDDADSDDSVEMSEPKFVGFIVAEGSDHGHDMEIGMNAKVEGMTMDSTEDTVTFRTELLQFRLKGLNTTKVIGEAIDEKDEKIATYACKLTEAAYQN